jgi:hypothetical protein
MPHARRRPPRRLRWLALLAVLGGLVLAACTTDGTSTASPAASVAGSPTALAAASSGLCQARQALPDVDAADRAFTNFAHDALHELAADARLDRPMAGTILEAMEAVESDFDAGADEAKVAADLLALHASTDEALRALNEAIPPCD